MKRKIRRVAKYKTLARKSGPIRTFKVTACTSWYDAEESAARSYELHFTGARRACDIRRTRRILARRCGVIFQQSIYRETRKWIPKRRIKIRFERETRATKSDDKIRVEGSIMMFRGRRWWAQPIKPREVSYARKRRRKRRSS